MVELLCSLHILIPWNFKEKMRLMVELYVQPVFNARD